MHVVEVRRTVRVKLNVPDERRKHLHETLEQFNTAVNYSIKHGHDSDGYLITTKSAIHDEVYYELRERTDLPANLCVRAYSEAVGMLRSTVADWKKGNSRPVPTFDQPTVVYDKRTLTIKDRSATLSTVDSRVEVGFELGEYQVGYLEDDNYQKRMGTLHYDENNDQFYLHILVKKEVEERDGSRVLGVDLNLENVAVTSTGSFYDGGNLMWGQNHYFRVRRSLQDKGTRSAKQALMRLSGRETRFVLDRLHTISRRVVEEARQYNCSYIAVEDLTDIRDRINAHKTRLKRQMHGWAFRELQEQIEYKAADYGIKVVSVNPAYSSQICSKCDHQSSTNRDSETGWFACTECGYEVDGDYNAAKNIGLRLVTLPEGKRPSGLGDGHLALKSGTLTPNGDYTAYDPASSVGES